MLTPRFSIVTAVLVEFQNLPEAEAEEKAKGYKGFGPTLFQSTEENVYLLGKETGTEVYAMILSDKGKPGGLPKSVTFPYYKKRN